MNSSVLRVALVLILIAGHPTFAANESLPKGYEAIKEFELDPIGDGLNGTIQLLAHKNRNKNGILRLNSSDRKVIFSKTLQKENVNLSVFYSQPGEKTLFFLTEDWSIEFGSYNGPITSIISITEGTPREMEARDERGNYRKIFLMRSLKTAWKPISSHGSASQILKVSCRPDFETKKEEETRFKTTYSRFTYNAGKWQLLEKQVGGLWEDEGAFPPKGSFPAAIGN